MTRATRFTMTCFMIVCVLAAMSPCMAAAAETAPPPALEKTLGAPPGWRDLALRLERMHLGGCTPAEAAEVRAFCQQQLAAGTDDELRAFFLREVAATYFAEQNYDRALEVYQQVVDLYPNTEQVSWAKYGIGEQYFHKARYGGGAQGMIRKYMPLTEEFIRQYPKHYYVVGALYARGWGCEQLGDKAAALAEYQRAVDEYPQYPHSDLCMLRVAAIHQQLREWDEAIAAAHKYLELYPHRHPWEARFSAGISYYRKGDARPAIAEFTEAFDSSPAAYEDRAAALFFRAMSHKALEEPAQARQDLEQLLASYPKHKLAAQAREELAALGGQ